jgi:hypothetical protein
LILWLRLDFIEILFCLPIDKNLRWN